MLFLWRHNAEGLQFDPRRYPAGAGLDRFNTREVGRILVLEIQAAADTGGS